MVQRDTFRAAVVSVVKHAYLPHGVAAHPRFELVVVADDPDQPDWVHERLDLEAALGRLPAGYRTVVILHDVEGWTHEQIAERLDVAVSTSKSQLSRGRRVLRSLLATDEEREARV